MSSQTRRIAGVLALGYALIGSPARATTHWEIPLSHQTFPDSKDLSTPVASLSIDIEGDILCVRATVQDSDSSDARGMRKPVDQFNESDSYIRIYIDPKGDSRSAQVFGINLAGSVEDGLYREAGRTSDAGIDFVWDGVAATSSDGWEAQFRIPLRTLYLPAQPTAPPRIFAEYQRIGASREVYVTQNTNPDGGCQLCHAPALTGFPAINSDSRRWRLRPTIVDDYLRSDSAGMAVSEKSLDYGFDAAIQASPNWSVVATLHPNFADREPDQPVLTKDAQFTPYQPETRPFFSLGTDLHPSVDQVIYTRQFADPSFAVQAVGRPENWSSKWLFVEDRGGGSVIIPGTYFNSAVLAPPSTSFLGRNTIGIGEHTFGATFADRDYGQGLGANKILSVDAQGQGPGNTQFAGAFTQSSTTACMTNSALASCSAEVGHSAFATVSKNPDLLDAGFLAADISPGFRNDLGWEPRTGTRFLNVWWWPSQTKGLPSSLSRIDWQPQFAIRDDSEGRTMLEYVSMQAKATLKSGPTLLIAFQPLNKQRLAIDQPLINARTVEAALQVSPSKSWYFCEVDVTVGELPDFYNARAARGYTFELSQRAAIHRNVNIQLSGTLAKSRADNPLVSGATIQEGAVLLLVNYQIRSNSRLRWAASWQRSFGWNLSPPMATPFSDSDFSQTVSWIHEPRVGLGYSVTVARESSRADAVLIDNTRATAKVSYVIW